MSTLSPREWFIQYESLKKKVQTFRIQGGGYTNEEIRSIISSINTLDNVLKAMSENPSKYELASSEIARRQVLIESLKKLIANGTIKENKANGLAAASSSSSASSSFSSNTQNPLQSERGMAQKQKDIMKLQDDMLLDIEKGVGRIHEKAVAIGDEARVHNRLLDELDTNVDIATAALQAEAKHAEKIKEQSQMCYMYICIVVEVLIIVILMALAFSS